MAPQPNPSGIEQELRAHRFPGLDLPEAFVLPHFPRYSLLNLANTVLDALGVPPLHPPLPEGLLPRKREVQAVVLLLVDALGYRQLMRFLERSPGPGEGSEMEMKAECWVPLTSVFPSTTAVTLATLHTALPPREHGLVGYRLFLREVGLIANVLRLKPAADPEGDRLLKMGLSPRRLLGVPTIHERLHAQGVRSYVLIPKAYVRSGLSRMLSPTDRAGTTLVPFYTAADMAVRVREILASLEAGQRAFLFAYWDALDSIAHEQGPESPAWDAELRSLLRTLDRELLGALAPSTRDRTLLLITADHGQIRVLPKEKVVHLKRYPSLVRKLRFSPTGEYRAAYLYAKPGALRELEEDLKERFAEELAVLRSEEALEAELFGPCPSPHGEHPEVRERLGDLIVIPKGAQALYWPYDDFDLVGRHGGLTDEEMLVPFLAV